MWVNDDDKICVVMDVLVLGIGEIIGGSQCEEWLDLLDEKMDVFGFKEDLWWYWDLCRYGMVFYVGFGLGFEWLFNYIIGLDNVCDVILFFCVFGSVLF